MTSKQRWRAVVERKGLDRLPVDYWGTGEINRKMREALRCRDDEALYRTLGIDKVHHVWPDLRDPHAAERNGANVWGITHRTIEHAGGAGSYDEVDFAPLAACETVADVERFRWPDPDWWTHGHVAERCRSQLEWPLMGGSFEPFYLYSQMRGVESAMEDLVEHADMVEAALERIFQIEYTIIERTLRAAGGAVDLIYVAEDLGSQESLLFSPAMFKRFLKPRMKKMIELTHRYGAVVFHHDDGAIRAILPELLEVGIDILNPIQWRCGGMDRGALKRDFGDRLIFHGAMDNQQTLPFGSEEAVRQEVRDNVRLLGAGGGYILAPCHNLQSITPVENVLAMYDEVKRLS